MNLILEIQNRKYFQMIQKFLKKNKKKNKQYKENKINKRWIVYMILKFLNNYQFLNK